MATKSCTFFDLWQIVGSFFELCTIRIATSRNYCIGVVTSRKTCTPTATSRNSCTVRPTWIGRTRGNTSLRGLIFLQITACPNGDGLARAQARCQSAQGTAARTGRLGRAHSHLRYDPIWLCLQKAAQRERNARTICNGRLRASLNLPLLAALAPFVKRAPRAGRAMARPYRG